MTAVAESLNKLFVGGRWIDGSGSEELSVLNPATEQEIARVPQAAKADVVEAIARAREAFDSGP